MTRYVIQRLVGLIPVFFGITVVSFAVMHLAPGTPLDQATDLNVKVSWEARARLHQLYGLDDPVPLQYRRWVGRLLRGDFGESFLDGRPVLRRIGERIPITLGINLCSFVLALSVAIPLGVVSAARAGSRLDQWTTMAAFLGFAMPAFWLALLGLDLFGVQWRWLPVSGLSSLIAEGWPWWRRLLDLAHHLILPVTVMAIADIAVFTRYMRASMLEVLQQEFIRTARAKGLPPRLVFFRHAFRNALLPLVTLLGLAIPGLLGGSVIMESIFAIPGLGRLFFEAVMGRDYPLIMGMVVMGSILTLVGNLIADLAYASVDPRVRYASG